MEVHLVRPAEIHGRTVLLGGAEARHVSKVLRHGPGDELRLTDGTGRYLLATIERASASEVKAEIHTEEQDPRESHAPWSTLGLALLKGDHFDLALEKATELGVHHIVPLLAQHCVVKWKPEGSERKVERWQRVVESAMKQSGRSWCPRVSAPLTLEEALAQHGREATVIVADEQETARSVYDLSLSAGQPHFALIGPEGAFSAREKEHLAAQGALAVSLGPFRLRSETAAIALMAALHKGRRHERIDS